MNNQLQVFEHEQFGELKTIIGEDGAIYFDGNQVARMLGYKEPHKAIARHCKGGMKHPTFKNRGGYPLTIIPEPDLYRLVANSQLPSAEKFERWVFEEVLPSIRKHGAYMTDNTIEKLITDPDLIIGLAQTLKEEKAKRKKAEQQIEIMKPKELFADAVTASKSSILIGELAKLIKQNGYDIGQNRLFEWLRENGYLIKRKGENYNTPTQYSMELGLMEIKKSTITNSNGSIRVTKTPKVTGKGQVYFINKFLS